MQERVLRSVVESRLNQLWPSFANQHPHLAAAIDRVVLTQRVVADLTADAQVRHILEQAAIEQSDIERAMRVLSRIDDVVLRTVRLPIDAAM